MIEIHNLTKHYKDVKAVKDLNLKVEEGDCFGFIGPNGAGKTTTINMLATLLEPTHGTATIGGYDIIAQPEKVRGLIGYMPDFYGMYEDLKTWEYLDFFAASYRIEKRRRLGIVNDVLNLTDLQDKKESFVGTLSRGMRQRLCLAKTLVHDPKILLLDEPCSGLDPRGRIEVRELLKELKRMGKTIFVSSHILTELADICNKIGIIENGNLLVSGDVEEIIRQVRGAKVVKIVVIKDGERAKEILQAHPKVESVQLIDNELKMEFSGESEELAKIVESLVTNKISVVSCTEEEADLEDIFMKITKGIVS